MNEIQRLIHEMCPDGVPMVALNILCNVLRGKRLTKDKLSPNGKYPVFHGGLEPLGYYDSSNRPANSVMVINVGASAGTVGFCDHEFWSSDGCFSISHNPLLHSKFLYYYLFGQTKNIQRKVRVAGIPTLDNAVVEKIQIPLPPLPIQQRIVEILDKFTSLVSSLDSEIALRQKQYEYYRDKLLSFEEGEVGVEMKKLKDACEIRRGIRVVKKQLKDNALYPVFQNSIAPMGYYDQYNRDGNMPYIICAGSSSGSVGYCYTPFWAADDCYTIESRMVNSRYIFYALKKNNNNLFNQVRKGSMPRLPHEAIDNMVIPVPSLTVQQRIVDTLDTFESLLTNLKKERELRQKQYEYYRKKLLTFA